MNGLYDRKDFYFNGRVCYYNEITGWHIRWERNKLRWIIIQENSETPGAFVEDSNFRVYHPGDIEISWHVYDGQNFILDADLKICEPDVVKKI